VILLLLTISVHLASIGIAPLLVIPFSESIGRRPVMVLSLLLFLGANIGLIFRKDLVGFLLLRILQAAGSAPLYVLGV
jgi:MFS transporter, DHA1 family, multidrug resistance protein